MVTFSFFLGLAYPNTQCIVQISLIQGDSFLVIPPSCAVIKLDDYRGSHNDAPRNPYRRNIYKNMLAPRSHLYFSLVCCIVRYLLFPSSILSP